MTSQASNPGARVRAFVKPRSIAVIGASADENKIGGRPIRYLKLAGYRHPIYPINPGRSEIQGLKAYQSLQAVEGEVDLAIIAVPTSDVLAAVEACVAKGVNGAMIFSSGFAEVDEEGRALQQALVETARRGGVALLGPNCGGTFNVREGLLATFTSGIVDRPPRIGSIGMVSQSGAFGIHMIVLAAERELGVSMCVTTGNQSDLDTSEALCYVVEDPDTKVVVAVIEGVLNPDRMLRALERARVLRKPVIVLKLGRSEAGSKAAASHTASLAGSDATFDAVLRQHNVYRVHTIDEMFDIAYACSLGRYPANDKVGIITVSGGAGILMADQAADAGLDVAELPPASQAALKKLLPFAAVRNPVDVTAQVITHPHLVGPMFDEMLVGGGYGAALAFITHIPRNPTLFGKLVPHLEAVARKFPDRFLMLSAIAPPGQRRQLESFGYAVFEEPGRALRALRALVKLRVAFDAPAAQPRRVVVEADARLRRDGAALDEREAKAILAAAGIPCALEEVAASADEAVQAAGRIGFPVVMKILSPDIPHKSEIGGVLLGVDSPGAVRSGYATLLDRARSRAPDARLSGILVARQVSGGTETILGVSRDPVFGPIVMFGLGGIAVEVLKDVAFRRAPFGPDEARRMVEEVKGLPLLRGARGAPPADEEALIDAIVRLSDFAIANADSLESVDINPFIVWPRGQGAFAVDALVVTRAPN